MRIIYLVVGVVNLVLFGYLMLTGPDTVDSVIGMFNLIAGIYALNQVRDNGFEEI
jgi:multidrug transporter EmrE-like cation transporter